MDALTYRPSRGQGCLLVVALALVFQPILVGDLFGYLVYGEWMIEHGAITVVDQYSFTVHGAKWVNHEWLFQVLLAGFYRLFGWYGLLVLQFILTGSILYAVGGFVDRKTDEFSEWAPTLLLPLLALVPGLTLRPQLFTYLAILLTVAMLYRSHALTVGKTLFLVVLFGVWANVHGGVLVGLAFLVFLLFRRIVLRHGKSLRAIVLFVLCSLATLVNPYGPELWRVIAGTIHDPMTAVFIEEWRPTWEYPFHMTVWSLLGLQWVMSFLRAENHWNPDTALRVLCLLGVAVLSLWPRRNLTYYGLAVAVFAPPLRLSALRFQLSSRLRTGLLAGGYGGGIALLILTVWSGFQSGDRRYPSELLTRIDSEFPQRVFVHYPWAQWAFYRRSDVRVFLDGRWKNVYSDDVIRDYGKILLGRRDLLEEYGSRWVLLPGRYPINEELARDDDWNPVAEAEGNLLWRFNKKGVSDE